MLRELYLYSGNQCAYPDCVNVLLDDMGTLHGEIAHIEGVKPGSARFNARMTNEERRAAPNLVLMCPIHHNSVDDPKRIGEFSVERLREIKADHESKYRNAINALSRKVGDVTDGSRAVYPTNLLAIPDAADPEILDTNLAHLRTFLDLLSNVPPAARELLALILVHGDLQRWYSLVPVVKTSATQVEGVVTGLNRLEYQRLIRLLEERGLVSVHEDEGSYYFVVGGSTPKEIGWDIFADLKNLAGDDRTVIYRAISELDFSVFDA